MSPAGASVLERAGEALGDYLPRIGAALAVLVVGVIAVSLLARLLRRLLVAAGLDRLADRARVHDALAGLGLERSLSRLVVFLLRLVGLVAVVLAAASVLGLEAVNEALGRAVLFVPQLLAALALAILGLALGGLARERVDRVAYQMDLRGPLGSVAQVAVVSTFLVLALGQIGVPTGILVVLSGIIAAGVVLTGALAFGLGSRDLAGELSAGRYVSAGFEVGQQVTIDGDRGELTSLEPASVLLATADGRTLRIPNSRLMASTVELHDDPPGRSAMS